VAAESVEIEILATVSEAVNSLQTLEKVATKSADDISKSFDGIKTAAIAAVAVFAGKQVFDFFSDAIDKAVQTDEAMRKLESSLKSVGDFSQEAKKDFEDFSGELEKTSSFSDDVVLSQLALAKQLGLTNTDAKKLVQTAADLATVTGDSLETSFSELSKTLKGSAGAISNTIPELKKFTKEQLEAGAAIDYVADRLKGSALDSTNTYKGALNQLGVAFDDAQKAIGRTITQNPVVIAAIKGVTSVIESLGKVLEDSQEPIENFVSALVKIGAGVFAATVEIISTAIKVVSTFIEVMASGAVGISQAIVTIVDAFLSLESVRSTVEGVSNFISDFFTGTIDLVTQFITSIREIPGAATVFNRLGIDLDATIAKLEETSASFDGLLFDEKDFDKVKNGVNGIKTSLDNAQTSIGSVSASFTKTIDSFSDKYIDSALKIIGTDNDIAKSAKKAKEAQEEEGQAAVKASVEAAKEKAKQLEIEEKFKDKVKSFTEELTNRTLTEREKVQKQLEKDNEQIALFENNKVIKTNEAERLRNQALKSFSLKNNDLAEKDAEKRDALLERILSKELGNLTAIELAREKDLKNVEEYYKKQLISAEEAAKLNEVIVEESNKRILAAQTASYEDFTKGITTFTTSGLQGLAKSGVEAITNTILPGLGAAAGELFAFFSQSTDKFKEQLATLFSPEFFKNIAANLIELVKAFPGIVASLSSFIKDNAAQIIEDLITAIIAALPEIASGVTKAFISLSTDPQFLEAVGLAFANGIANGLKDLGGDISRAIKVGAVDISREFKQAFDLGSLGTSIKDAVIGGFNAAIDGIRQGMTDIANSFKDLFNIKIEAPSFGGGGGVLGDLGGAISSAFGFAEGGIIPTGFPNDTFPARLTSGEMVLPPNITSGLLGLIDQDTQATAPDNGMQTALLNKIYNALNNPQQVSTAITIDGRELANVILNLSRNNARLFA
jgi:hypothetical protein